jgi:hypothetical protein
MTRIGRKSRDNFLGHFRALRIASLVRLSLLAYRLHIGNPSFSEVDLTTVICLEPSVSRECGTPAKLQHPADASWSISWRDRSTEVPMPVVHNDKSRAKHYCDGAAEGGRWCANTTRSWFVLFAFGVGIAMTSSVRVEFDLTTVICQEPSVSRECGTPAKLQHPADASWTICWRPFEQT